MMRVVIIIVAALMILGLAAFGVVSAQKMAAVPASPGAPNTRVASSAPGAPAAPRAPVSQPVSEPVSQIAQAGSSGAPSSAPRAAAESAPAWPTHMAQTTAQTTPAPAAAAPSAPAANSSAQSKPAAAASNIPPCDKPGGMGLARVVEIDTTGGPGFGFEHFKQYDFLRDKEIVLTFDDGPWPANTPAVLKALADECLKATFFEIGEHATWHPEITKQVIDAGMTVGTHTWSHRDLARNPYAKDLEKAEQEIEMGNSAVHMAAAGAPIAPFFRFPDLQHPPQLLEYLAQRNIAIFSTDIDSRDFKIHKPDQLIKSVMSQLEKRGKGIILMHDFKKNTAETLPELLRQLKAAGYKVVHMVPKQQLTTLPKYDEMVTHQDKLSSNNTRPENSVVRTIGE
jgi:peptidoglycan/xylan/chitin deacetylase (PgdA/CDA1 family)